MVPTLIRIDNLLFSHTESVSFFDLPQHPWKQLCNWNDSHFHTILHVQVIRSQLRLHCSIRTFHSSNFLVTSNTRLCQSRCFVSSSLYPSSNLDDAGLTIRLDLDTFVRTQESKHHLHAVFISFRTHFCRGQIAIVLSDHHETVALALGSSTNVPSAPTNMKSIWILATSPSIGCGASR